MSHAAFRLPAQMQAFGLLPVLAADLAKACWLLSASFGGRACW
jgi:hypothetical protein